MTGHVCVRYNLVLPYHRAKWMKEDVALTLNGSEGWTKDLQVIAISWHSEVIGQDSVFVLCVQGKWMSRFRRCDPQ